VQGTLRDSDETRLLSRLATLLHRFPREAETEPAPPEGWCSTHSVQMSRHRNAKGSWWSHKVGRESGMEEGSHAFGYTGARGAWGAQQYGPRQTGSSRPLKGAMSRKPAFKRGRLAEERPGEAPEAGIALWGNHPLTSLAWDVSQWHQPSPASGERRTSCDAVLWQRSMVPGSTCLPPCQHWEAAESGRGSEYHATSIVLPASSRLNTGSFLQEAKGRGEEVRETPTKSPLPQEGTARAA
jgi:hypothetical protein